MEKKMLKFEYINFSFIFYFRWMSVRKRCWQISDPKLSFWVRLKLDRVYYRTDALSDIAFFPLTLVNFRHYTRETIFQTMHLVLQHNLKKSLPISRSSLPAPNLEMVSLLGCTTWPHHKSLEDILIEFFPSIRERESPDWPNSIGLTQIESGILLAGNNAPIKDLFPQ